MLVLGRPYSAISWDDKPTEEPELICSLFLQQKIITALTSNPLANSQSDLLART
jgi:hypothetical protein